jgi:hypothetical protein
LFQPVERRSAAAVAGGRVGSGFEEHLDGLQEARLCRVVQRRGLQRPDAGGTLEVVAAATICRAGTVAQQRPDVVRIVLAALVPGAGSTDPRS